LQALSCLQVVIAILWFVFLNVLDFYEHWSLQNYTSFFMLYGVIQEEVEYPTWGGIIFLNLECFSGCH
jgi:hypothetical protein